MSIIASIRKTYRRFIRWPWLDQLIYQILDWLTNVYSKAKHYSFPTNYIRRWKLNMLWELYEPETVSLAKKIIKPGMVVVDIGAHIGYFTRIFSNLSGSNGTVLAFEADPENFALLKQNTSWYANVKTYEEALSEQEGFIDFYHCEDKAGCHSILSNIPINLRMRKIVTKSNTLDNFLKQNNISRVDVIKMDIEGGEYKAIQGMKKTLKISKSLALIVEFAPAWVRAGGVEPLQFLKELNGLGFELYAITLKGLVHFVPSSEESYAPFIPPPHIDGSAYNQFVNIYCAKGDYIANMPQQDPSLNH